MIAEKIRSNLGLGSALAVLAGVVAWMLSPGAAVSDAAMPEKNGAAQDWKPAPAPLMTRFARDVSPDNPLPEYPRPLFVRQNWQSLNGMWQLAFDDADTGTREGWHTGRDFAERILVPFPFEAALSGLGRNQIHERIWYRRGFTVPEKWKGQRLLLHFGAVDWEATVFINGRQVGEHKGGYTPFSLDITDALRPGERQELVVRVFDPAEGNPVGWQPRGKQRDGGGIWYTRSTGIWKSVWLEPVPTAHIQQVQLTPGLTPEGTGTLAIAATLPQAAEGMSLEVQVGPQGKAMVSAQAVVVEGGKAKLQLKVPSALAWTPETPHLYDLSYRLTRDGKTVDEATGYSAFRSVGIARGRLTLNHKPYFYRGVLDQGYWPEGIYTPPTDEALRFDVEMTKRYGFNMARKHIKVEDPRWYYWCDRLGVAVWQDMPSVERLDSPQARENFRKEWEEVISATRSYPCVVHWIPFNENWGNPGAFQDEMVELARRLDPSRPITDASGWIQRDKTDVLDSHNYSDYLLNEGIKNPTRPKVIGEYGGVGLRVPGHIWKDGETYIQASNVEQLQQIIRRRTSQIFQAENISGFVYTQLSDVEQELNGLLTYDREQKISPAVAAKIFTGKDQQRPIVARPLKNWLVLGPIPSGVEITEFQPSATALTAMGSLLDTPYLPEETRLAPQPDQFVLVKGQALNWQPVEAEALNFHQVFSRRQEENAVVYAVTTIDSPGAVSKAILYVGSDDGVILWLNGKRIHRKAAIRGVQPFEDRISGVALRAGKNTLIAKVGQGRGGWGLTVHLDTP